MDIVDAATDTPALFGAVVTVGSKRQALARFEEAFTQKS
jgi:hypothetical protein